MLDIKIWKICKLLGVVTPIIIYTTVVDLGISDKGHPFIVVIPSPFYPFPVLLSFSFLSIP